jgi:hypothetical protein
MTRLVPRATTRLALLAALALLAMPFASAQHGPPPGYTDPVAYTQDYATYQTGQAAADPAGYASGKATPDALAEEAEHAAWLACWTAHEAQAGVTDPVCSQFFTAPGVVDAPAEAEAEITETLNATDALLGEIGEALEETLEDPTTAVDQVLRIVDAVVTFVKDLVGGLADLVGFVLDLLGLGGLTVANGLAGMLDGLLALVQLPALGLKVALDGLGAGLAAMGDVLTMTASATADGVVAVAVALADAVVALVAAVGDGFAAAGSALGGAASAIGDAVSAAASAVGEGLAAVGSAVSDAASAVGDALSSLFGGKDAASPDGVRDIADGVETGTEADGLIDRVLDLV